MIAQAGLFSAALTSFLADSTNNLQVDPAQQMVYYQQQNVALLAQISKQVASITPQIAIPSTPPPPYPAFSPDPSDVRVNVFWFMSLIFSLSAALLATLVQQWVRDYMHVFQRYSNPLKSVRLRQYLYEGAEGWYMPMVAESVPGLVHVSLFLFFLGLGDSLLSINTTVGVTAIMQITIFGLLYVLSMFAPVINPQSPFQSPFSGLIWYLKQKLHPRHYLDRTSGGSLKAVSSTLSQGQMQLAMEENDGRKDRDVRAIRWLIDNRTEDDEMESFVIALPGSFTSKWGIDVWRKVSEVKQYEDTDVMPNDLTARLRSDEDLRMSGSVLHHHHSPPFQRTRHHFNIIRSLRRIFGTRNAHDVMLTQSMSRLPSDGQAHSDPFAHQHPAIRDLCERVRHLVMTCGDLNVFTNKELWLQRARGCVETAASLVFCADIKPELFGDLVRLLDPLSNLLGTGASSITAPGLFIARINCLSFVVVNQQLEAANHGMIKLHAQLAIDSLSRVILEKDIERINNGNSDEDALRNARRIDEYFEAAREICVYGLRDVFNSSEVGMMKEILTRNHQADISLLERIAHAADQVAHVDRAIFNAQGFILVFAKCLIATILGVHIDAFEPDKLLQPEKFFNPTTNSYFSPQFIFLHQRLRLLCSYSSVLRGIIDGRGNGTYKEIHSSLKILWGEADTHNRKWAGVHRRHLMVRQLWRLQDLRDGGGFGYWVELFFLVVFQLVTIPLSPDNLSVLILGMFRKITSNWRQHKHSIATQRVILNLVCDLAIPDRGLLSNHVVPSYATDEFLVLLENMLEGQSGSHIDEATMELEDAIKNGNSTHKDWIEFHLFSKLFRAKAVRVLTRSQAPAPSS